jgi:hypothetical protein
MGARSRIESGMFTCGPVDGMTARYRPPEGLAFKTRAHIVDEYLLLTPPHRCSSCAIRIYQFAIAAKA